MTQFVKLCHNVVHRDWRALDQATMFWRRTSSFARAAICSLRAAISAACWLRMSASSGAPSASSWSAIAWHQAQSRANCWRVSANSASKSAMFMPGSLLLLLYAFQRFCLNIFFLRVFNYLFFHFFSKIISHNKLFYWFIFLSFMTYNVNYNNNKCYKGYPLAYQYT